MTRRYLNGYTSTRQSWRTHADGEPWQHRASCAWDHSESWFTSPGFLPEKERDRLANLCDGCPVIIACLEAAIRGGDCNTTRAGIWFRHSSQLHGRPQVQPWTEMWLDERRLPSELFRTVKEDE